MSWLTEWKAISDRIDSILKAGSFYAQFANSSDGGGAAQRGLNPSAEDIRTSIKKFENNYISLLPDSAALCLQKFINDAEEIYDKSCLTPDPYLNVRTRLTFLSAFRADFAFNITDVSARARRLSERAFSHLQRSMIADPTIKSKWQDAFKKGETACEKLGAAHLLQHGIWAFKVEGAGEATDLVFGEPLREDYLSEAERTSEALVLTEWKRVDNSSGLKNKIQQAKDQVALYNEGILGGLELEGYRYIVIVSDDYLTMPSDYKDKNNVSYCHRSIAVNRKTPSRVVSQQKKDKK